MSVVKRGTRILSLMRLGFFLNQLISHFSLGEEGVSVYLTLTEKGLGKVVDSHMVSAFLVSPRRRRTRAR